MTRPEEDADEIREHTVALRRLARGLCGDPTEAEDIVQDVWVRALSGKTEPPPQGAGVLAWMRGFVRNRSRERARADRRRVGHERAAARPERGDDPSGRIALVQDLLGQVQTLDPIYRDAIARCYLEGLTSQEAAALEGVSEVTIRTRLHRAISQLRRRMDERCGGREEWLPALAPLAWGPSIGSPLGLEHLPPATTLTTASALSLAMKKKLILAAALLLVAGVTVSIPDRATDRVAPTPPHSPEAAVAATAPVQARAFERDAAAEPPVPSRTAVPPTGAVDRVANALPPLRVEGKVLTDAGASIGGVDVEAWWGDFEPNVARQAARTGSEGTFSFDMPVSPAERSRSLQLTVRAPGFALRTETREVLPGESSIEFVVRLVPGLAVHGLVIDEGKQPIEGARIDTFRPCERTILTDAAGRFVIPDLSIEDDKRIVRAKAEGFIVQFNQIDIDSMSAADGSVEPRLFLVMRRGSGVHGVIVDTAGNPVPDAHVHVGRLGISKKQPVRELAGTTTDGDGRYSIEAVHPGPNTLAVFHEDFAPLIEEVSVPRAEPLQFDATLLQGHELRVIARSAAGESLEDASLSLHIHQLPIRELDAPPGGEFLVRGVPQGGFGITVTAGGHLPRTLDFAAGQAPPASLDVVLDPAARIAATVVDARSNEPIRVFSVRFLPDGQRPTKGGKGELGVGGARAGLPADWFAGRVISSTDGSWDTGDAPLVDGYTANVEIRAEGYTVARADNLVARYRAQPTDRVIALVTGATLRGRVVTPDGAPIIGAYVECRPTAVPTGAPDASAKTAANNKVRTTSDGSFTLPYLVPGPVELLVTDDEWGSHRERLFVQARSEDQVIEVVMSAGSSIEGIARDAAGRGLPKARIQIRPATGETKGATRTATTDADGRFRVDHLGVGTHVVELTTSDSSGRAFTKFASVRAAVTVELAENTTTRVELQSAGGADVLGSVTMRSAAGELLPGPDWLLLTFTRIGDPSPTDQGPASIQEIVMKPNGSYDLESIPPGAWSFDVIHTNKSTSTTYRATQTIDVPVEGALVLDVELREVEGR
ncbi:MAG: sigma-70 family RNA polymerase sigma factor [Planctomycetota bacterium]|nr:sigma-70 family RNA polymerase sigma factor [Planctomycetota bacterium]